MLIMFRLIFVFLIKVWSDLEKVLVKILIIVLIFVRVIVNLILFLSVLENFILNIMVKFVMIISIIIFEFIWIIGLKNLLIIFKNICMFFFF